MDEDEDEAIMQIVEEEVYSDVAEPIIDTAIIVDAEVDSIIETEVNQVNEGENEAEIIISADMSDETPYKCKKIDTTEIKKQQIKH